MASANARDEFLDKVRDVKIHGSSNAFSAKEYPTRSLWLLSSLIAVGFCTYGIVNTVMMYVSYPVKTEISYQDKAIFDFPAVTICNRNSRRKSVIESGLKGHQGEHEIGHQLSDMLLKCKYKNKDCSAKDFILANHSIGNPGNCYTFNSKMEPFRRQTEDEIIERGYGLRLVLNTEEHEYLNETTSVGFFILVHDPAHVPSSSSTSISASPGFETHIALNQVSGFMDGKGVNTSLLQLTFRRIG